MLLHFLCAFFFKFVTAVNNPKSQNNEELSPSDYQHVIVSTRFHEYIDKMVYAAVTTIHGDSLGSSYDKKQSLLGFTNSIPATLAHGYPCQQTTISGMTQAQKFQHTFDGIICHRFTADSRLCGNVSTIFTIHITKVPPSLEQLRKTDIWYWIIKVNIEYKINLTFLYMHVSMVSQCSTLQALVSGFRVHHPIKEDEHILLGVYCPDFPVLSFFSTGNSVRISLKPAVSFLMLLYRNHLFDEKYGNCSFLYQIHRKDFYQD